MGRVKDSYYAGRDIEVDYALSIQQVVSLGKQGYFHGLYNGNDYDYEEEDTDEFYLDEVI